MEFSLVHWVESLKEWDTSMSHIKEGPNECLIVEVLWKDQGLVCLRLALCLLRDEFKILGKAGLGAQWEEKFLWGGQMLVYPRLAMCLPKSKFEIPRNANVSGRWVELCWLAFL